MSGPVTEAKGVIRNRSVLAVRMEDVKGQEGAETRISCTDKKAKTQSLEWAKAYWRLGRGGPGQWSPSLSAHELVSWKTVFSRTRVGLGWGEVGLRWFNCITFTMHFISNLMPLLIWQEITVCSAQFVDPWVRGIQASSTIPENSVLWVCAKPSLLSHRVLEVPPLAQDNTYTLTPSISGLWEAATTVSCAFLSPALRWFGVFLFQKIWRTRKNATKHLET